MGLLGRDATAADAKPGVTIFVAPQGNDVWSGSLAEPNAAKTDGPLATLAAAREKIRGLKKDGPLPAGGVEVVLRGGMYFLERTFQLAEADSGTAEVPVVYRAAAGEKVQLIGGRPIRGFEPYRGAILKANVAAQGLKGVYFRQLFFDGRRQPLARYPNFDPKNPYGGGWAYVDGKPVPPGQEIPNESHRTFQYKEKDARQWSRPEEAELFAFPRYNWQNIDVSIAAVNREKRIITLTGDTYYPLRPGDRYYVQNIFEELDSPGEWYLDRRTETLYFWPPASLEGKTVCAPTLSTLVAIGPGTAHVTVRGFILETPSATTVTLEKAHDCLIAGNTIRNAGDYYGSGVEVKEGQRNGVVGNDIYEIGCHGISLSGGDRITLTPAGNYAENNYIHHTGVFYKQGVGVNLEGVGNRATHNLIHDCPRMGILFSGNNLAIEYNHIRHVNLETCDTGGIYTGGRDWISSRGTRICYNYLHDMLGYGQQNGKWVSPYDTVGIYLDDNAGGVDIIGNVVARSIRGLVNLHNARDTRIENNILIDGMQEQVLCNGWTGDCVCWTELLPQMIRGYESVAGQTAWRNMRGMDFIRPRPHRAMD